MATKSPSEGSTGQGMTRRSDNGLRQSHRDFTRWDVISRCIKRGRQLINPCCAVGPHKMAVQPPFSECWAARHHTSAEPKGARPGMSAAASVTVPRTPVQGGGDFLPPLLQACIPLKRPLCQAGLWSAWGAPEKGGKTRRDGGWHIHNLPPWFFAEGKPNPPHGDGGVGWGESRAAQCSCVGSTRQMPETSPSPGPRVCHHRDTHLGLNDLIFLLFFKKKRA